MSLLIDSTSLIPGSLVIGNTGLGVKGSTVPSSGKDGPSYLYNDLVFPADNNVEVMGRIKTFPTQGKLFAYEDGSFGWEAPNVSTQDSFVYTLYIDGVSAGDATVKLNSNVSNGSQVLTLGAFTGVSTATVPPFPTRTGDQSLTLGYITNSSVASAGSIPSRTAASYLVLGTIQNTFVALVNSPTPVFSGFVSDFSASQSIAINPFVPANFTAPVQLVYTKIGTWPDGIDLDANSGSVSGTPTAPGTYSNLKIRATTSFATYAESNVFQIVVVATGSAPVFAGNLPDINAAQGYPITNIDVTSRFTGSSTLTYSLNGSWPTGVSIDSSTGIISGTPSTLGNFAGLSVRATDTLNRFVDSNIFNLVVSPASTIPVFSGPQIISFSGSQGNPVNQINLNSRFTSSDNLTFSLVGNWPKGFGITIGGFLVGTPTETGNFQNLYIRATNSHGQYVDSNSFTIYISAANLPPQFRGPNVPNMSGSQGELLTNYDASGSFSDTDTLTYSLVGNVPNGVSINVVNGVIQGVPSVSGSYSGVKVRATDTQGQITDSNAFQIRISPSVAPTFSGSIDSPTVTAGLPVYKIEASRYFSGGQSISYSLIGPWPSGISIDVNSGSVSGISTVPGVYSGLKIRATNFSGAYSDSNTFGMNVLPATSTNPAPVFTGSIPNLSAIQFSPSTLYAAGALFSDSDALVFTKIGSWPNGISVDPSTGNIGGNSPVQGVFENLQILATDTGGNQTLSNMFSISINPLNGDGYLTDKVVIRLSYSVGLDQEGKLVLLV